MLTECKIIGLDHQDAGSPSNPFAFSGSSFHIKPQGVWVKSSWGKRSVRERSEGAVCRGFLAPIKVRRQARLLLQSLRENMGLPGLWPQMSTSKTRREDASAVPAAQSEVICYRSYRKGRYMNLRTVKSFLQFFFSSSTYLFLSPRFLFGGSYTVITLYTIDEVRNNQNSRL